MLSDFAKSTLKEHRQKNVQNRCYMWDCMLPDETPEDYVQRFELRFWSDSNATIMDVTELSTQDSFRTTISGNYRFHLAWIQLESVGDSKRCKWLQNVLDHFAEELSQAPRGGADPLWRSPVLNPLLMRVFYQVPDDQAKSIKEKVVAVVARSARKDPTIEDWKDFYTSCDVINPTFETCWTKLKPHGINQGNSGLSADAT
ncbi:hypothetical protein BDM02DRAFT_3191508 [Thelephora ganbajun]|uniref:Uncharacterized protein n=1 Tax=Thelephora ganbajun TaxID=370292 RepID=A0ACB6Z1H3_THEGA|nr:hypothetical protein BDM02DRAFT_3191508 [Thelephora ganbajun]